MNITLGELVGYVLTIIGAMLYFRGMYLAYVEYRKNGFNDSTLIVGVIHFVIIVVFFATTIFDYLTEHWDDVIF